MPRQLLLDVLPAPAPTLDNYVPGANAEALAAARSLRPGQTLYLWGPPGCGRSHLLRGLADCADPARLMIADDVHRMDAAAQSALFTLYNRWRSQAASPEAFALVVAGDRAPIAMPLREDLRTRLGWGLVYRLQPLSDDDKRAALIALAETRGLALTPEVLNWILTHYERDIRKLTALLDALDRYSLAAHRAITVPLLRAMLADTSPETT